MDRISGVGSGMPASVAPPISRGTFRLTQRDIVWSDATQRNGMEPRQVASSGVKIAGMTYLPAAHVAKHVGVSRTTLWRWRHEGKVPLGRRYRNGLLLFTSAEVELVRKYADKVEPVAGRDLEPTRHQGAWPRRQ